MEKEAGEKAVSRRQGRAGQGEAEGRWEEEADRRQERD